MQAQFPLSDTFKLHSLAGATKRIFLDFDGHLTDKTIWQTYFGNGPIDTPAFSLDSNYAQFSDVEREAIQDVWARVAEDFAPFLVDVTTEDPGVDALVKTGATDTSWGIRVVVGGNGAWNGAAGVAVFGGFGDAGGAPAFAFADQWWKTNPNFVAGCISHEVGHTLGLSHDGHNGSEYYGGRGTGPTSWGPLMGNPDKSLTQWSKGDYGGATRTEDDLAIITSRTGNGFGYRVDDHGDTPQAATAPVVDVTKGIIERSDDMDVFKFVSSGTVKASVKPMTSGANLDVLAEILDAAGAVLFTSNPTGKIDATFDVTVSPGTYYLRVQGTGEGDPLQTGYTKYGSLGQYTVTIQNVIPPPIVSIADVTVSEGNSGETVVQMTVSLSKPAVQPVAVKIETRDGTATVASKDYVAIAAGTAVNFGIGESSKQLALRIIGDRWFEADERFAVVLSNPEGVVIGRGEATCTIANDDPDVPVISIADVSVAEGNDGQKLARLAVTLSKPATTVVTVGVRTEDGTARVADGDYLPIVAGTRVSFAPGQTTATLEIPILGDRTFESDEDFRLVLSDSVNALIASEVATFTIRNDDRDPATLPRVTLLPAMALETPNRRSFASFRLLVGGEVTEPMDLTYVTRDGTARAGRDYRPVRGSLRILPGQTEAQIAVAIADDRLLEEDEAFSLVVSADERGVTRVVPWTTPLAEQRSAEIPGVIVDDDSRFISMYAANQVLATGDVAAFTIALGRVAGFGEVLPSSIGLEGLPAQHLEVLSKGMRFSSRYSVNFEPAKRGGPGGARASVRTGLAEFGWVDDVSGAMGGPRVSSEVALPTTDMPLMGTVTARLYGATNARLQQSSLTVSLRPVAASAFAAIGSPSQVHKNRVRWSG